MKNDKKIIEQLVLIKDRLNGLSESDGKSHLRSVGIDLYQYVKSIPFLNEIWVSRAGYMYGLLEDVDYMRAENEAENALEIIAKIGLQYCDAVKQGRSEFPKRYSNPFSMLKAKNLTLPELFTCAQDRESHYTITQINMMRRNTLFGGIGRHESLRNNIVEQYERMFHLGTELIDAMKKYIPSSVDEFIASLGELKLATSALATKLLDATAKLHVECFEIANRIAQAYEADISSVDHTQNSGIPRRVYRAGEDVEHGFNKVRLAGIEACDTLIWEISNRTVVSASPKSIEESGCKWFQYADFEVSLEPLALRAKNGKVYEAKLEGKCTTENDKELRKALRVIAAFAPKVDHRFPQKFKNLACMAKVMNIRKPRSLSPQLTVARKFLEKIGSTFTISRASDEIELVHR